MTRGIEIMQYQIGLLQTDNPVSLRALILKTLGVGERLRVAVAPVSSDREYPPSVINNVILEIEHIKAKLRIQIEQAHLPGCLLNGNGQLFWVTEYSAPPTKQNLGRIHQALVDDGFYEFDLAKAITEELGPRIK